MLNDSMLKVDNPFDKLQVQIPGMQRFQDAISTSTAQGYNLSTSWISEYLAGLYQFMILTVGIFAAVSFIIGGVIWIMAAGSPARIGEAKSWMASSLMGLTLAMTSYLILYTINPEMVILRPINTIYIEEKIITINNVSIAENGSETNIPTSNTAPANLDLIALNKANTGADSFTASNPRIDKKLADDLKKVMVIAHKKGIQVTISSAYRSIEQQRSIWNIAVKKYGSEAAANKYVARPSYNAPHVRGVAIDAWAIPKSKQSILQAAFAEAGWKRYCNESWHFQPSWAPPAVACSP